MDYSGLIGRGLHRALYEELDPQSHVEKLVLASPKLWAWLVGCEVDSWQNYFLKNLGRGKKSLF